MYETSRLPSNLEESSICTETAASEPASLVGGDRSRKRGRLAQPEVPPSLASGGNITNRGNQMPREQRDQLKGDKPQEQHRVEMYGIFGFDFPYK